MTAIEVHTNDRLHAILKEHWGHSAFRASQLEIIHSVLNRIDTLALLPTGGGKSICFQLPVMAGDGMAVVVSPLIALMKDQVMNLKKRGIAAAALFSGLRKREVDIILDKCVFGQYKFLYVSPERLSTEIFRMRFEKMPVSLIAVDEAHCISQWGYDFRPAYLKVHSLRELKPQLPIVALTASATPEVVADIQEKLCFESGVVIRKSFVRKNLSYSVLKEEDKGTKLKHILGRVPGTAIVYVRSRRRTVEVSEMLTKAGIKASFYHGGLEQNHRQERQDSWANGRVRVMVCTNAFGMGIDKSDVRLVVHLDMPDTLEAYFQEAGRAGRDGQKAYAVMLYQDSDIIQTRSLLEKYQPSINEVLTVYDKLGSHLQLAHGAGQFESFDFDLVEFSIKYDFLSPKVLNAIKILEQQEIVSISDELYLPSRIMISATKQEVYKFEVENPRYERLLKFLLRNYSGLFDGFVAINEEYIAKSLNMHLPHVKNMLHLFQKLEILKYISKNNKPVVTFLSPRVKGKELHIDRKFVQHRLRLQKEKIKAVIDYAENRSTCRSTLLVRYFGEKGISNCGICDYCTGRNRTDSSEAKLLMLTQEITTALSNNPLSLEELVESFPGKKELELINATRFLMDNRKIQLIEEKFVLI